MIPITKILKRRSIQNVLSLKLLLLSLFLQLFIIKQKQQQLQLDVVSSFSIGGSSSSRSRRAATENVVGRSIQQQITQYQHQKIRVLSVQQRHHHHHHHLQQEYRPKQQSCTTTTTITTLLRSTTSSNDDAATTTTTKRKLLYPNVGDVVQYYDLDGGNPKGQVLMGKITFISSSSSSSSETNTKKWMAEIMELDQLVAPPSTTDTDDKTTTSVNNNNSNGLYYTEYSKQNRRATTTIRNIEDIRPVVYVLVRYNNILAYKVSTNKYTLQPLIKQDQYDVEGYTGPFTSSSSTSTVSSIQSNINTDIILDDAIKYNQLKIELLRNTILFGSVGTILTAVFTKGNIEDSILYASGVLSSCAYIYFLSVKTDTMATSNNSKLGKAISNIRFIAPVIPLVLVSIYNSIYHTTTITTTATAIDSSSSFIQQDLFKLVSTEQFFAIMVGFLSYRIPLFFTQIRQALVSTPSTSQQSPSSYDSSIISTTQLPKSNVITPGKVSLIPTMAATIANPSSSNNQSTDIDSRKQLTKNRITKPLFPTMKWNDTKQKKDVVATLFVISGPSYTGRTELVQRFVQESQGQFVLPTYMDRYTDVAKFEYIEERNGFIYIDQIEQRYGLTRESFITEIQNVPPNSVMLIDTDVEFAIQLSQMGGSGLRLVAVWVTLSSMEAFVERMNQSIDAQMKKEPNMSTTIPDEGRNIEIRTRTTQIVQEIELGISSGLFEFTIINDKNDMEQSLKELRDASKYCYV